MKRDDLKNAIKDIGTPFNLKPDFDMRAEPIQPNGLKQAPNRWEEVKNDPDAHGADFDYRILDGNVFMPTCEAAQEWVRAKFPEGCRYFTDIDGWTGVVVESGMQQVIEKAHLDGLISEEFYEAAMNDRDERAGE